MACLSPSAAPNSSGVFAKQAMEVCGSASRSRRRTPASLIARPIISNRPSTLCSRASRTTSASIWGSSPLMSTAASTREDECLANSAKTSSAVGIRWPANLGSNQPPASSCLSWASVNWLTLPWPSVVRSTVSSCTQTRRPSCERRTSNSNPNRNSRQARMLASVFSGASSNSPRCATTSGRASSAAHAAQETKAHKALLMSGKRRNIFCTCRVFLNGEEFAPGGSLDDATCMVCGEYKHAA